MKKILFSIALLWAATAYSNVPIENTIKKSEGVEIKVISSAPSGVEGLNITVLQQPNGFRMPVLSSKDGKTILGIPDVLISDNDTFKATLKKTYQEVADYNASISQKAVLDVFKKYDKTNVVKLEGKNKSKTTYMIVDLNCPYCHQEIEKIDETLKDSNVDLLVIGALGMDSVKKAATFYEDIKTKKSQQDKIAFIKSAFEKTYKPKPNINTTDMITIGEELAGAGVNAVPYIIRK